MPISKEEWAAATFIGGRPGFTPQIGALVDMMHYARLTTLDAAEGLSAEELDTVPEGFSNSIGMLLAHIAATDRIYQAASFEDRDVFEAPEYAPYLGASGCRGDPWTTCCTSWKRHGRTPWLSWQSATMRGWPRSFWPLVLAR
jgi:hypothetical protein